MVPLLLISRYNWLFNVNLVQSLIHMFYAGSVLILALWNGMHKTSFTGWYPDSKVHGANMGPIWGRQDTRWVKCLPHELCNLGIHLMAVWPLHRGAECVKSIILLISWVLTSTASNSVIQNTLNEWVLVFLEGRFQLLTKSTWIFRHIHQKGCCNGITNRSFQTVCMVCL